jgi:predicted nucleotidyltransferase
MESVIQHYLEEHFPDSPAFLYGSRVDGYQNENSDWDVGIIGTEKYLKIKKIEFTPINTDRLEMEITRNIHGENITPFVKKVIPVQKCPEVRVEEKRVKLHITNYILRKLKAKKESTSGRQVVLTYLAEDSLMNPIYRPKYLRFKDSEKAVRQSADLYDSILKDFKLPISVNYRNYGRIDALSNLFMKTLKGYSRNPIRAVKNTKLVLKNFTESFGV